MSKKVAVVMAAGKGTRMASDLPKALVEVAGRPMIEYVLDALDEAGVERTIVVVGYRADDVRAALAGRAGLATVEQTEQLGTGHAVMVCRQRLAEHDGPVFVIAGDNPLIQSDSVARLFQEYDAGQTTGRNGRVSCVLGTVRRDDPFGLGRVIRDENGEFAAIVEEKDATDQQRLVTEVNMSYYVFDCRDLLDSLDSLRCENAQGEYYITDVPGLMKAAGGEVRALEVLKPCEALGVNTVEDLAAVEAAMADE